MTSFNSAPELDEFVISRPREGHSYTVWCESFRDAEECARDDAELDHYQGRVTVRRADGGRFDD